MIVNPLERETEVINIEQLLFGLNTNDIYIGRENLGMRLAGSVWANPFRIDREADRAKALRRYENYLRRKLRSDALLQQQVRLLKGHRLVCYCKPKACHGDVLKRVAELSDFEFRQWLGQPDIVVGYGEQLGFWPSNY